MSGCGEDENSIKNFAIFLTRNKDIKISVNPHGHYNPEGENQKKDRPQKQKTVSL
jgi:hypothetical protein